MKQTRNEKGFSMIELIVVVAIMAIIGAVLIPQFSTMSQRSRLTTDATTVKTLNSQIVSYKADIGTTPTGLANGEIAGTVLDELVKQGYLEKTYLITTGGTTKLRLQTPNATCQYQTSVGHLVLQVSKDDFKILRDADPNKNLWIVSN